MEDTGLLDMFKRVLRKNLVVLVLSVANLSIYIPVSNASWLIYHKPEFRGMMIDADTKKPIEGAVVVGVYEKYSLIGGPGGGYSTVIKAKETLTDKKGEFYFPSYTTIIQPLSKEDYATFIIYKPGYWSHDNPGEFIIWALPDGLGFSHNRFSETLKRRVEDKWKKDFEEFLKTLTEKRRARTEQHKNILFHLPFLPMKNAPEKLQKLDIPFFQIPDDVDLGTIKWINMLEEHLNDYDLNERSGYMVIGLPRAKTIEERLRAVMVSTPTDLRSKELPSLYRAINEEERRLGLKESK